MLFVLIFDLMWMSGGIIKETHQPNHILNGQNSMHQLFVKNSRAL